MTSVEKPQVYSREVWRATRKRASEYATQACDASLAKRNSRRLATALTHGQLGSGSRSSKVVRETFGQGGWHGRETVPQQDVAKGMTELSAKLQ